MLCLLALASPVQAHGNPPALDFFGDFGPSAARCQRVIGLAARRCAAQAVQAHSACMIPAKPFHHRPPKLCAIVDARVEAVHQRARDMIEQSCTDEDTSVLQFGTVAHAQTDVVQQCHDVETAVVSAISGPILAGGSVAQLDGTRRDCMVATVQETRRLLRFATRAREDALDHIVVGPLTPTQKHALIGQAARRIDHVRTAIKGRIEASCSDAEFATLYGRDLDSFLGAVQARLDCVAGAAYVQSAVTCPPAVCGNGIQEPGEQCDDGNTYDSDLCRNDCTKSNCQLFPSTFDLIQQAIFEQHGCTNALCHGRAVQGGLDLRADRAYAHLVDATSTGSPLKRVEPGDEERSFLWLKLAAATLQRAGVPGTAMPQGLPPLSEGELEALRLWIYSGAPQTGVVRGTADLLNACLPEPEPLQIRPPAPPTPGSGVQLHMPRWVLLPNSESEVCFATYYDVSAQVPEEFRSPDGKSFRYNGELTTQDPLSHHLIANLYRGEFPVDDPSWGTYQCNGGAHDGEVCNPLDVGVCGPQADCATPPVRSVACIGQGPPDNQLNINSFGFTGTQKTVAFNTYPNGVFAELPLKGVILWNSHAFNLADQPAKLEAWLNFYFAPPAAQQRALVPLLNTDKVFAMHAPAFGTDEICNVHVLPTGAQLFEISSHMHKRGKRFRIFRGAFTCSGGAKNGQACSPLSPEMCPVGSCLEATGRDASVSLLYTSLIYNDPVVLRFDPPLGLSGPVTDRSFTYCALYDNGFTDPATVKRKSTSAIPPLSLGFGGPCAMPTHCVAGMLRQPCSGHNQTQRNASCDSSPGAGDGFCDACPLVGGVTTDDEMFVLVGSFFMQ